MAETVTIGGKTYTKPENAQAGWLAEARKAGTTTPVSPVAQPTQTNPVDSPTPIAQPSQMEAIKNLPQYQDLLNKGYKADDIEKAVAGYKPPQTQVQPQAEIKPATPIAPVEQVQAPVKKQAETTPQTEKNKTGTMDLLPISEYQDDSTDRMNQIVSNLNQYRQSAPQFMGSSETFRDTFAYEKRSQEQKKLLDNWYAGYKKGEQLSTLTNGNITDMYNAGTVSSNDLENLRLNNPAKYSEVMNEINKKNELKKYSDELYGTEAEPVQQATPLSQPATTDMSFFDEYKNTINSDEVKTLNNDLLDKQTKIDQLRLEMTSIEDEIKKQYEGTGATESKIGRIIADAQSTVQKQINSLGLDYNNLLSKYNSIVNTAESTYKLNLEQQNYINTQRNQKMQELGFYYQYDPKGIAEQATAKYNAENPDIDSTNSDTSKQALNMTLDKYYEDYGMIIQRPKSQVINDIQALAKNQGISVSQALKDNFITPLQGKTEYKALVNKALGIEAPEANQRQFVDNGDGTYKITQTGTGALPANATRQQTVQAYTLALASAVGAGSLTQVGSTVQNMVSDGEKGGQCGVFANNISTAIGSSVHFGDTLASKTSQINSKTPEIGSFVVMDSKSAPSSGHVGMVTAVNGDGTIQVKSSNYKGDEKVRTDTISTSSGAIKGYVKPNLVQQTGVSDFDYSKFNNTTFKPQDIKDEATKQAYKSYLTEKSRIFNDPEATAEDILKVSMGGGDISDTSLQKLDKFTGVLASLSDITKSIEGVSSGPISGILSSNNPYNTKAQLLKAQLTSMTPALARGVYGEVGVLTDNDIKLYQQTIPNLRQTKDVQQAVLAMTLKTVQRGMENSLKTQARAGKDVSGFIGELKNIQAQVQAIETSLGIGSNTITIGSIYSNNGGVGNSASMYDLAMGN